MSYNFIVILRNITVPMWLCGYDHMPRGQKASTLSDRKRGNKILDLFCMCTEAKTVEFRSSIWINYPNW